MAVDNLLYSVDDDTISYERDLESGSKIIIQSQEENRRELECKIPSLHEMTHDELLELNEAIETIIALLDLDSATQVIE